MSKVMKTRTSRKAPAKSKAKVLRGKAAVKRSTKVRKASKATKNSGGGKALPDFSNTQKLRVLKAKEIPSRAGCFKTGMTVAGCLTAQKSKGFRGRRKFLRVQISAGRVSLN